MENLYDRLQVLEQDEQPLSDEQRLEAVVKPLLFWYEGHARILPWRERPEPYRVWISEIMLQQTRVEAVKPYFERFMDALPTIKALAGVDEDRLLKLWEGLGYYNRARNLKKAAILVEERYGGKLPASCEDLLTLPGIGSYTAGAVASIAYGLPVPAVDGNVLRVISRLLGSRQDILKQSVKKKMEANIKKVIPRDNASAFNQGLIEIGAIVCIPNGQPKCQECPFASVCVAKRDYLTHEIPVKTPKKPRKSEDMTVFLVQWEDRIGIQKRREKGLLASLYEFPNAEGHLSEAQIGAALGISSEKISGVEALPKASHIFSHVEWHMIGYRVILRDMEGLPFQMAEKKELFEKYPVPNAFKAYTKLIK